MTAARVVLVVAKAPVPGRVKTRLMTVHTAEDAAALASAALIDTLDTALSVPDATVVVSLAGVIDDAVGADDLHERLSRTTVVDQHGDTLGDRLDRAHRDAVAAAGADALVMQVGMDTPHLSVEHLEAGLDAVVDGGAALGHATDGGWWGLALRGAVGSSTLPAVPMSRPDTGIRTEEALRAAGLSVTVLPVVADVDHPEDVAAAAALCPPTSAFARLSARLLPAVS
ncbi:TIGR04282 family arsenosugar biosynthesis glycosyltransferase [Williamsia sp. SKLECPSW1]